MGRPLKEGVCVERSTAGKLFIVLLTALLGIMLIGVAADAHFPGKACENETPLAKNKHCSEGHGGDDPGQCSDGIDNDGDGFIDEDDPDCGETPPPDDTECSDGIDNDEDGATDGFDRDCTGPDDDDESGSDEPECSDGVDNDRDRKIDFGENGDPDCESDDDDSEAGEPPVPACDNGVDDDGDGLVDGDDPGCTDENDDDETDPTTPPQCSNGEDDDGDGLVDGDDPGCTDGTDDDESDDPVAAPTCGDPDGDGVDHSAFDNDSNEGGLVSSIVHEVDLALPSPLGGDQGVVTEVNCALVVTVEEIVGING
jgi:hypothetical protein